MHYSKTAFQITTDPTIVTRIEAFSDVIGQRMDFSDYDLEKLNKLYNCCKFLAIRDKQVSIQNLLIYIHFGNRIKALGHNSIWSTTVHYLL